MSVFCACATSGANGNTGTSNAALQLKRAECYYLVPKVADDSTKNVILSTDLVNGVLPETFIKEKINNIDPSKRWYPLPQLRSITNERATPETQTFDGGQNSQITAEGLRTVSTLVLGVNAKYKKNLDKLACLYDLAFFEIDECGAMGGEENAKDETIFEPHPIGDNTFYTNLVKAQGSDGQTLQITFEYDSRSADENECVIPAANIELDLCEENGLLNAIPTFSATTTTSFTATISLEYGGFQNQRTVPGLVAADFLLFNVTDSAAVVITTVTENPANSGIYDFTFPLQDSSDVLQLQQAFTGNKYDKEGFEIVELTTTVP